MKSAIRFYLLTLLPAFAMADYCPAQLIQDHQGYWVSQEAPGWKSASPTPVGVTVNTNDFGGAHFSPKQQRMACVYRQSHGGWIALVSHKSRFLRIDRHARNPKNDTLAWEKDPKHQDFTCSPHNYNRQGCPFEIDH